MRLLLCRIFFVRITWANASDCDFSKTSRGFAPLWKRLSHTPSLSTSGPRWLRRTQSHNKLRGSPLYANEPKHLGSRRRSPRVSSALSADLGLVPYADVVAERPSEHASCTYIRTTLPIHVLSESAAALLRWARAAHSCRYSKRCGFQRRHCNEVFCLFSLGNSPFLV